MSSIQQINAEFSALIDPKTYTGEIVQKEGIPGLLRYLNQDQYYALAALPAHWGVIPKNSYLHGRIGFHAMLRLPGERQCEWQPDPKPWDTECAQMEMRQAKGKVIEKMWATHKSMYPRYHRAGNPFKREGYLSYLPFVNDCHTYVNTILTSNNEPESTLKRI